MAKMDSSVIRGRIYMDKEQDNIGINKYTICPYCNKAFVKLGAHIKRCKQIKSVVP